MFVKMFVQKTFKAGRFEVCGDELRYWRGPTRCDRILFSDILSWRNLSDMGVDELHLQMKNGEMLSWSDTNEEILRFLERFADRKRVE